MDTRPAHIRVTPVGDSLLVECSACGPVGVFPAATADRDLHTEEHQ